jgi:radical SAM-linked protein
MPSVNSFIFQVRFTKEQKARFLSHRELMTLIERAVRRADIPIKMSEGFNPRPRISFPLALSLGVESDDEVIYLMLEGWLNPQALKQQLQSQLIAGIIIKEVVPVNRAVMVRGVEYLISFKETPKMPSAEEIKALLVKPEIIVERRKPDTSRFARLGSHHPVRDTTSKMVNIRPYIHRVEVGDHGLYLSLKVLPEGTVRPEEILRVLGIKPAHSEYHIKKIKTVI